MADGPLDLACEQRAVMAEVPFQGVLVDHDPVLVTFPRNPVAGILAVGADLVPAVGDHHGNAFQHLLKLLGQPVDRIDDQRLEIGFRRLGQISPRVASRRAIPSAAMARFANLETLPGADLLERGAEDLDNGRESAEALLVSIGSPRLQSIGIELPSPIPSAEHKLYLLLAREKGDGAHSAYNAMIRRLVSFERAAACVS